MKGAKVLAATLDGADAKTLRETMDKLKDRLKSAAIVLGAVNDGKVALIAGVTADLTGKLKAGELVNHVAQQVGGKGGGRPGHGAGRRHRARQAAGRAAIGEILGGATGMKRFLPCCECSVCDYFFRPWHTMAGASTTPRRSSSSPARSSSRATSTRTGTCASRCRARLGTSCWRRLRAWSAAACTRNALKPGVTATVVGYPNRNKPEEMRAERIIINGKTVELR